MRKYIIYCDAPSGEKVGAFIEFEPREWSSDDYGEAQQTFVAQFGKKNSTSILDKYADMFTIYSDQVTSNGIIYSDDIVSVDGAAFTLLQLPGVSRSDITAASRELKRSRDVVCMYKLKIAKLVDWSFVPTSKLPA